MIIKNLLSTKQAYKLQHTILAKSFEWFWNDVKTSYTFKNELFQFVHSFYKDRKIRSKHYDLITPIIYELTQKTNIKIKSIVRIKANLIPRTITNKKWDNNNIHQDVLEEGNYISVIYYMHNCDGDTVFYADNKKTIIDTYTPKENSCYILNSKKYHRSSAPKENQRRVIINFIFEVESTDVKLIDKPKETLLPNIIISSDQGIFTHNINKNTVLHNSQVLEELNCKNLEGQGRPTFRPFGIAVDNSNYYIASNEKIGKFNIQTNQLESLIDVPLFINTHQILKDDDTLYVCNTSTDTIGIYKLNKDYNIFFDVNVLSITNKPISPINRVDEKDTRHVNSLFDDGTNIWFCLHNKALKPSEYGYFNKTTFQAKIIYASGFAGHGIIIKDNFLYTMSTKTGELIAVDLNTKKENRYKVVDPSTTFIRGLIYTNGKFLIGCSVNFKTPNPIKHSYIAEVDIIAGTLKKHDLEGIKAINDMQIFE
jgi:hypothetical protein